MPEFYDRGTGFLSATEDELDRCAVVDGGMWAAADGGYGSIDWARTAPARHGYGLVAIATGGTGNHGRLILRGLTPEKRSLILEGAATRLQAEHEFERGDALDVARAQRGVRYGHEARVVATLLATRHEGAWRTYPGLGGGVSKWARGVDGLGGLSCPRIEAVYELRKRLGWHAHGTLVASL